MRRRCPFPAPLRLGSATENKTSEANQVCYLYSPPLGWRLSSMIRWKTAMLDCAGSGLKVRICSSWKSSETNPCLFSWVVQKLEPRGKARQPPLHVVAARLVDNQLHRLLSGAYSDDPKGPWTFKGSLVANTKSSVSTTLSRLSGRSRRTGKAYFVRNPRAGVPSLPG